jgi:hypothetical protein
VVEKWGLVCFSCLLIGFLFAKLEVDIANETITELKQELTALSEINETLGSENGLFAMREVQNKSQIESLLEENKKLNIEVNDQAEKLYFYKRVISPEGLKKEGIDVFSFVLTQPETDKNEIDKRKWNYELVLMQSEKARRFLKGNYQIIFSYFEGKDETLKQISLNKLNKKTKTHFKFKYFQTIDGSFEIPPNFTVDSVEIKLKVPGNRWHRSQSVVKVFEWVTLINPKSGSID